MSTELLLLVLSRFVSTLLVSQGKSEYGQMLGDITTAYRQGKQVDDILQALADKWDIEGEPSFDDIAAHRASIQARLD